MKKNISYLFLFLFSFFSFFVTYKTAYLIKQADVIMQQIKKEANNYTIKEIDGIINDDTIIPGINGLKVNINKSYNNMKRVGFFSDKQFVYDAIKNNNLLINNIDKYIISGSNYKKAVSLLLYVDNNTKIDIVKNIDYPLNIIINQDYLLNHEDTIKDLVNKNYNILIYNIDAKNINNYVTKINQQNNYCFNSFKDNTFKKICMENNFFSVLDENIIKTSYLLNIKKNLGNGKIFTLKGSYETELKSILNYIDSKGYSILNLDDLLDENNIK